MHPGRTSGHDSEGRTAPASPPRQTCRPEFGPATNVVWKTAVPAGHSSPVLTPNHIFLTAVEGDSLLVLAYDRASGRERWRRTVPRRGKGHLDGPELAGVPLGDDGRRTRLHVLPGCRADRLHARRQGALARPARALQHLYGFGASPIVVDGMVLLAVDQNIGSYLLAVDARTGKTRYKVDRPGVISGYSTPTVYQPTGGPSSCSSPRASSSRRTRLPTASASGGCAGWRAR